VQDATWYLGNTPDDAYVKELADYFTKYTFSDPWRDLDAYGLYVYSSFCSTNGQRLTMLNVDLLMAPTPPTDRLMGLGW
jgi:hypothetical protein